MCARILSFIYFLKLIQKRKDATKVEKSVYQLLQNATKCNGNRLNDDHLTENICVEWRPENQLHRTIKSYSHNRTVHTQNPLITGYVTTNWNTNVSSVLIWDVIQFLSGKYSACICFCCRLENVSGNVSLGSCLLYSDRKVTRTVQMLLCVGEVKLSYPCSAETVYSVY